MGVWFAGLVLCAAIVFGLVQAGRELGRRRRLRAIVRDTTKRAAAELSPGVVAVEGRVVASGSGLRSPIGGVACVAYRVVVERRQRHSRRDREWIDWSSIHHDQRRAALSIEDETGRVAVELGGGQLDLGLAERGELSSADDPAQDTPAARALALAKGDRRLGLRWEEACLREGEQLFVLGTWSGSAIGPTPLVPVVASKLGREGAVRELGAGVRQKVFECAFLGFFLLFFGAALALKFAELGAA